MSSVGNAGLIGNLAGGFRKNRLLFSIVNPFFYVNREKSGLLFPRTISLCASDCYGFFLFFILKI